MQKAKLIGIEYMFIYIIGVSSYHRIVWKLKALSTKYLTCSSSVYICSYMQVYILSIMRYAYVDDDKDKMPEA